MEKNNQIPNIKDMFPFLENPTGPTQQLLEKLTEAHDFASNIAFQIDNKIESVCHDRLVQILKSKPNKQLKIASKILKQMENGEYDGTLCITATLKHEHAEDLYITAVKLDNRDRLVFDGHGYYTQENYSNIPDYCCSDYSYLSLLKWVVSQN